MEEIIRSISTRCCKGELGFQTFGEVMGQNELGPSSPESDDMGGDLDEQDGPVLSDVPPYPCLVETFRYP